MKMEKGFGWDIIIQSILENYYFIWTVCAHNLKSGIV